MKTQTMRTIGDWATIAPWRTRKVSIICLSSRTQAFDLADKRAMVTDEALGDLLVLWHGTHYTEARVVDEHQQRMHILDKLA